MLGLKLIHVCKRGPRWHISLSVDPVITGSLMLVYWIVSNRVTYMFTPTHHFGHILVNFKFIHVHIDCSLRVKYLGNTIGVFHNVDKFLQNTHIRYPITCIGGFLREIKPIILPLMLSFHLLPGHQKPWYWLYDMWIFLSSLTVILKSF